MTPVARGRGRRSPLPPGPRRSGGALVVCPTPIGNLEDITLRVLRALAEADVIACEDTRRTRVLLDRHGLHDRPLTAYHEHNEGTRAPQLAARVAGGDRVALVSDAGMPLVSDPGHLLLRRCLEEDLLVEVLPGPSAPLVALVASGLGAARFTFVGFLPRRAGELGALWREQRGTVVAFESPNRLAASLRVLAAEEPDRPVAVCRELTKLHEEVVRGSAAELAARYAAAPAVGEVVLVAGPAAEGQAALAAGLDALEGLVQAGARSRPAATVVARLTGASANALYRGLAARRAGAA